MPSKFPKIYFYQLPLNEQYYGNLVVKGLRRCGAEVMSNDLAILTNAAHRERIQEFKPDLILTYGFTLVNLLCRGKEPPFFLEYDIPLVTIFADNPLRYLYFLLPLQARSHLIFCCDSTLVNLCQSAGLTNTQYLPLFFDPEIHYPRPVSSDYMNQLVFPGTVESLEWYHQGRKPLPASAIKILDTLDRVRQENPFQYVDFFSVGKSMLPLPDIPESASMIFSVVCSQATLEQKTRARMEMFDALRAYPIHVYGVGNSRPAIPNLIYHPYLNQHADLPVLYSSCALSLCLEILPSCVHQRVYEASAAKGFILSEWRSDYENLFTPDNDIVMFTDGDDLVAKVDYYMNNPEARHKIAEAAYQTVQANHTVTTRMHQLLTVVAERLPINYTPQ